MNLIDVSAPIKLSSRAAEQVAKREADIEQHEAEVASLRREIFGIVDNDRLHSEEDDEAMTARLRRNRTHQGFRQVRYHLTGQRKKQNDKGSRLLKAFNYIYRRAKGSGYRGVEIPISDLTKHLDISERQVQRILDVLENHTPHRPSERCPVNPGVILRLPQTAGHSGASRFVITLPESMEYCKMVLDALAYGRGEEAEDHLADLAADYEIAA